MRALRSSTLSFNNWLFIIFFLFTTLSGAIRKWVFTAGVLANVVLLVQLVFPFVIYFLLRQKKKVSVGVQSLLVTYFLALIGMAFNPLNQTIFHGILGIIIHFGFWLAAFTVINNIDRIPLERLTGLFIVIFIVEVVLGGIQYNLPFTHVLNQFAHEGVRNTAHVGDAVRAVGTFSYIGGYGALIVFAGYLGWSLGIRQAPMIYQFVLLGIGLMMALFSGSRAPTVIFLGLSFLGFLPRIKGTNIFVLIIGGLLFGTVLLQVRESIPIFDRAVSNLEGRFVRGLETGEQNSRIWRTVEEIIYFQGDYPLFGTGLGATYQGAKAIWGESIFVKQYGFYEEEPERLILEGGYILYLFKLLLLTVLFLQLNIPWWIKVPLLLFHFFFYPIVFNVYQAAFLFLGLALVQRASYLNSLKRIRA